jgi:hypothetical protein
LAIAAVVLVGVTGIWNSAVLAEKKAHRFENAQMVFEQNATDGDVEVVFRIQGGDEGLKSLKIQGPDGSSVFEAECPAPGTMGLRQFNLESPEPRDTAKLRAAFPEGRYTFSATSASGMLYEGTAELRHALPDVAHIEFPQEDAEVSPDALQIRWKAVPGVQGYVLELEQEETGLSLTAHLPADATSFSAPAGFLKPGEETTLGLGTVAASGNASFVEISFEIAE